MNDIDDEAVAELARELAHETLATMAALGQ
jgi:hypothetical protein